MARKVTVRRACHITGLSTRSVYAPVPPERDTALKRRLREVYRPSMGYRMAHALVQGEFAPLNVKKVHRLWKELALVRTRRPRPKRRTGETVPLKADAPNQVWCVDFCYDGCLNGSKLKILAVKDEFTRECLALEVGTRFRSREVQAVLGRLMQERGAPRWLRSDNGPEFLSRSLRVYLALQGSGSRFIEPGSPWQNGHAESFVSRLRAECLDAECFYNLADAQVKLAVYRRYYNEVRPHSSLGYVPPVEAARTFAPVSSGRATPLPSSPGAKVILSGGL
jgi:transposase InsO family protein